MLDAAIAQGANVLVTSGGVSMVPCLLLLLACRASPTCVLLVGLLLVGLVSV